VKDDTREELERIEKELLTESDMPAFTKDEPLDEDSALEAIVQEFSGPAFDDPMEIHEPEEPMVYCNYNNDYGNDTPGAAPAEEETPKKEPDKVVIGLMIAVCCLSLGIIGVLAYWLNVFF